MKSVRLMTLVAGFNLMGCQVEDEDLLGGIVRLHNDDLCAGTRSRIAQEVDRIEDAVGLSFRGPVDVFLYEAAERCQNANVAVDASGAAGCAPNGTTVIADSSAISHELVHALRLQNDIRGRPFFEEGIAAAVGNGHPAHSWTVSRSDFPSPDLADSASREWNTYRLADSRFGAHFASWALEDEARSEQLRRFLSADYTSDLGAAFESAFGGSFAELQADWESSAQESYSPSGRCLDIDILDLREGPILMDGVASCDDPGTEGNKDALLLAGRTCFRVDEPVRVRLSSEAEMGTLLLMPADCSDSLRSAPAGEEQETTIGACTWSAAMTTGGDALGHFSYQIELVEP